MGTLLGQGDSRSSSAHLVTFRCTWMQSLAETHRKYVCRGKKRSYFQLNKKTEHIPLKGGFPYRAESKLEPLLPGSIWAQPSSWCWPSAGRSFFAPTAIALPIATPCSKLSLSDLFPPWHCPRAGDPPCVQGSLCLDCPSPLFFLGKEAWLAGGCSEFVTKMSQDGNKFKSLPWSELSYHRWELSWLEGDDVGWLGAELNPCICYGGS